VRTAWVVCVSDAAVLRRYLLSSPGLPAGWEEESFLMYDCGSAAEGFNAALALARSDWLVFVHQDVVLPQGWFDHFCESLDEAQRRFPRLAVAGVYGKFTASDGSAIALGEVMDRGRLVKQPAPLPHSANSIDELLFAVRRDSGLTLDAQLGFHLYGTDLALAALSRSLEVVVLHAPCEHHSTLPFDASQAPAQTVKNFIAAARVFAAKWADRMPLATPCWDFASAEALPTLEGIKGRDAI
jgi:glycosyl transferase family 2